ncbi:hypothetical protein EW145_g1484 [Phellinidium pouzarii]|uniref:SGNH hydrolase-type esterase domain-containing protein n=1 Tax=Phellinidium pouzarii TaxID=167371 RepID=A0A4S4LE91_9AGAM|nr:hypothetical protein EW145_g1484 [Phellinidium pouzarii]
MPGGIAQRLAHEYARIFDVINRGFSGYNTDCAIPVFEQSLVLRNEQTLASKMRLLTIWYGANDSVLPGFLQHVPLARFDENLTHLINMVRNPASAWYSPETKIILITPPPINTNQRRAELAAKNPPQKLDRAFDVTAEYAETVRRVGAREQISVVDAWQVVWDAAGQKEEALSKYLTDGLHVTAEGYTAGDL